MHKTALHMVCSSTRVNEVKARSELKFAVLFLHVTLYLPNKILTCQCRVKMQGFPHCAMGALICGTTICFNIGFKSTTQEPKTLVLSYDG